MDNAYDYQKFAILYVDDEEKALKYFAMAFAQQFRIFTAPNAKEGFRILREQRDRIALLMADQRMPGEQGVQLLEKARRDCPRILRLLVTAYADMDAAIAAVNTGAIYKYIAKPWKIPELELTLRRGLEFFMVQQERDRLLKERTAMIQNLIIADRLASLGVLAAGLNHHLRNSLVAIRTFLDLAPSKLQEEDVDLARLNNPRFWNAFHTHVQTQITRITEMLTEVGAMTRRTSFAFEDRVTLPDIISGAVAKLKERLEAKKIALVSDFPPTLPRLQVDQGQFQRLFELLLSGELLRVPEGSRIVFKARSLPRGEDSDWGIELEIHDQSPGLPTEAIQSMFDPVLVHAGHDEEYGIGLLTCYFIVFHHGGRIEVNSQGSQGVTFVLTFPTHPENPTPIADGQTFLGKVLWNEALWEKLIAGK